MIVTEAGTTGHGETEAGPVFDTRSLADAIKVECRLLRELRDVLKRQGKGIVHDDLEAIDETIVAAHRVMHTLGEARRRRRALLGFLAPTEDTRLDELDAALGPHMTSRLVSARARLHYEAQRVAREIEINCQLLSAALDREDRFIRGLCAAISTGYRCSSREVIAAQSGVSIDPLA